MDQTWLIIKGFLDSDGFIKFENSPISLLFFKNDSILERVYFEEFRYVIPEDSVKFNLNNVWSITAFPLLSHKINEVMCIDTLFKEPFREAYRYYSDNYEYTYDHQDNAAGITISTYSYPDNRTEIYKTISKATFSRKISETREFLIRPEIEVKDTYKDFENRVIKEIFYLPISGKFKEKRLKPRLTVTYEYLGNKVIKKTFLANKEKHEVTILNTFYPMD